MIQLHRVMFESKKNTKFHNSNIFLDVKKATLLNENASSLAKGKSAAWLGSLIVHFYFQLFFQHNRFPWLVFTFIVFKLWNEGTLQHFLEICYFLGGDFLWQVPQKGWQCVMLFYILENTCFFSTKNELCR